MEHFSVCISAYNEEESLPHLLEWLIRNNSENLDEIIVYSDGSTDKTVEVLKRYKKHMPKLKFLIGKDRKGVCHAISVMTNHIKKDLIVSMSADVLPTHKLDKLIEYFKDPEVGCVCGHYIITNPKKGIINLLTHRIFDAKTQIDIRANERGNFISTNGFTMAWKKTILPKIDFNGYAWDVYVGWTIRQKGYKVVHAREFGVRSFGPQTIRDYINQRKRTIKSKIHLADEIGTSKYLLCELPLNEYVFYILKAQSFGVRSTLSLIFGVVVEILLRVYYLTTGHTDSSIWTPLESTKGNVVD